MRNNTFEYTKSHTSKEYGKTYDSKLYSRDTYDNRTWEIEKNILPSIIPLNNKNCNILDFACGTGRISQFLENLDYNNILGIDVSDQMLCEARKKLKKTKLKKINLIEKDDFFRSRPFDCIISFRFFLNAEPALREKALLALRKCIKPQGILIFNIHGNKQSLRFPGTILGNFLKKIKISLNLEKEDIFSYRNQLSVTEVESLLNSCGFKITQVYSYALLPQSLAMLIPKKIWKFIEGKLITNKFRFGTQLLFSCEPM